MFDADEAMKDVGDFRFMIYDFKFVIWDAGKEDVADMGFAVQRSQDDAVSIAFNKRAHADAGRGKKHLFSCRQIGGKIGN